MKTCPVFLKQSFLEWTAQTLVTCAWAKAFYLLQREKGKSHHTAVRALAFKWIRLVHRMGSSAPGTTRPPTSKASAAPAL